MKMLRSSLMLSVAVLSFAAACGGDAPPPETPPAPPPEAEPAAANPAPAPPPPAAPKKEEPPPVPAKQKIQGKWAFDLMGSDPGKKAEEDAKKKGGKDEKKVAALMKKIQDDAAKEWVEFSTDTYTSYVGEKPVFKVKYEVAKEEGTNLHLKAVGKDEVSKKAVPAADAEMPVTLVDDNTLQMKSGKKGLLQFKRK
jgi:hypothetical protein